MRLVHASLVAHPDYLLVEKGWLFKKDLYIPIGAVTRTDPDEGCVYLNAYKDQVETMGWDVIPETTAASATVQRGSTDASTMRLREEELAAHKRQKSAGEVEIGKRVVTEQQTINVPVTHDEVKIERHPVDRRPAESGISERDDQTIRVPVSKEEVEVEKRPVVTEEVNIRKTPVTENRTVTDTMRREEAVFDQSGAVTEGTAGAGVRGGQEQVHEHRFVEGKCVDCGHTN